MHSYHASLHIGEGLNNTYPLALNPALIHIHTHTHTHTHIYILLLQGVRVSYGDIFQEQANLFSSARGRVKYLAITS